MSDYELISLYTDTTELFFTITTVLTTILFSYIAGMYLIARRIHWSLVVMLSGLFALVMYSMTGGLASTGARAASFGAEIARRIAASDSEIGWLVVRYMPPDIPKSYFYFFTVATLLALVFTVVILRSKPKQ